VPGGYLTSRRFPDQIVPIPLLRFHGFTLMDLWNGRAYLHPRRGAVLFRIFCEIPGSSGPSHLSGWITSVRSVIEKAQAEVGGNHQAHHQQQPRNALSCGSSDITAHRQPPLDQLARQ